MQPKSQSHELSLHTANKSTEVFCHHCGGRDYVKRGLTKTEKQNFFCKICRRYFVDKVDLEKYRPSHLELGDDVWDASELGLKVHAYRRETKLVFSYIKQDWLKDAAKKFVKYQATCKSFRQLQEYISHLGKFSSFLEINYPTTNFKTINREVVLDLINFLNQQKLNWETKNHILSSLNILFETGNINSWFKVPAYLIRPEDKAKPVKRLPRYIPEEVVQQLNQHLDLLPEPVARMVLVLQETGLRVGELLQLPINCLKHNAGGDPFIQYMNWKMTKEEIKPISFELAKVIQEQQQYIMHYLGEKFEYLFSARKTGNYSDKNYFHPKPNIMNDKNFINYLKKLALEVDIKDNSGKSWNFQSHQFRHTVGTRMINLGVPLHIIQRYLGHESPQMTMVYAHIHDETRKD